MEYRYKIVGIGNSIVNGFPLKRSECFLSHIRSSTNHQVINKGVNGETSEDVLKRLTNDLISHYPDLGIIMTGTNDFILKKATPEDVCLNFSFMVKRMEENRIRPVLLTPILIDANMASRCWMQGANIDYKSVNKDLAGLANLMMEAFPKYTLNLQGEFREDMKNTKPEDIYVDGLHPTSKSHQAIGRIIINYIEALELSNE